MPTYVYETIPKDPDEQPRQFEVTQSIKDDALTRHPETGLPVRRLISGGLGYLGKKGSGSEPNACSAKCGCC